MDSFFYRRIKLMKKITRPPGFTLIELLVVTVIIGILSTLGIPVLDANKDRANDGWAGAIVANASKILLADEFISLDGVNFADLDSDGTYIGTADPVTLADINTRLANQDYTLAVENRGICFLYGYESTANEHNDMIIIVNKISVTGTGSDGFSFAGSDNAKVQAENVTAINCTPGGEGVTGGTWTDYQWLNLIP